MNVLVNDALCSVLENDITNEMKNYEHFLFTAMLPIIIAAEQKSRVKEIMNMGNWTLQKSFLECIN